MTKREFKGADGRRKRAWVARVTFTDPVSGKRRELTKRARTQAAAAELRNALVAQVRGGAPLAHLHTFAELSQHYLTTFAREPKYVAGRKVAGLRSWKSVRQIVTQALLPSFGARRLAQITPGDVQRFREARLDTPTSRGKPRSIARVNRELSVLRRMFTIAVRERWMVGNPVLAGDPLISSADEQHRSRVLTKDEEARLLEACAAPKCGHVRPILISALDTGMRCGELLSLRWSDVDMTTGVVTVRAFNTKTMRQRQVEITPRLAAELRELRLNEPSPDALVFGGIKTFHKAFTRVASIAGVVDFRFHDCRHTAATRLAEGGLSGMEIGRILGHTQAATTYRYVNATTNLLSRAADILTAR
ncbi:MAG TPA: site-specific integrase [Thermoanaerobaculia bacterium]